MTSWSVQFAFCRRSLGRLRGQRPNTGRSAMPRAQAGVRRAHAHNQCGSHGVHDGGSRILLAGLARSSMQVSTSND